MDETKHLQHLQQATLGERFLIEKVDIRGEHKRRLLDLGFVPGSVIEVLKASPLGDPTSYRVAGTVIALRKEESQLIWGKVMSS
ncbi:FeoA family protein [Paenibacillus vortex V453]|jgi:ferrous iron transport protein A|uniref:Iron transporter FeoA n=2 Tax=Paenibacillus TaxID=44249 RepID=A0A163KPT3_9BACL|nr:MULTISPECIES: FeoA family protein [Paenibacillus]ANA81365.1 iron transporter FeoA [Paenibacillus glucanolyticus]AVV59905.1 ferrous iron transport protein A [Paenibacillus glucanolyticus]AWP29161.1 ferrous iron transport protein A [Paenibacillus sp. Cedars]EFU42481.1 FeoA family protein [Paenibacillus vortex V453]ETT35601.1 FeoA family protein [Paenibacillus sp. FSL R5-808]